MLDGATGENQPGAVATMPAMPAAIDMQQGLCHLRQGHARFAGSDVQFAGSAFFFLENALVCLPVPVIPIALRQSPRRSILQGKPMANPWTKKNPFLSMWLSGANSVASAARGKVLAESKRQTQAAVNESTRQMMQFWTGGLMKPPAPPRKKRKSR